MRKADKIYALYTGESPNRQYFYVGRSQDVARRYGEHKTASKTRHEAKYQHIRQLEADGIEWNYEVLADIPAGAYDGDYEAFWVIKLILDGHKLTNMKHGDAKKASIDELQAMIDAGVRTVEQVTEWRYQQKQRKLEDQRFKNEQAALRAEQLRLQTIANEEQARALASRQALAEVQRQEELRQAEHQANLERVKFNAQREQQQWIKDNSDKIHETMETLSRKGRLIRIISIRSRDVRVSHTREMFKPMALGYVYYDDNTEVHWININVSLSGVIYGKGWDQTFGAALIRNQHAFEDQVCAIEMRTIYNTYKQREEIVWSKVITRDEVAQMLAEAHCGK